MCVTVCVLVRVPAVPPPCARGVYGYVCVRVPVRAPPRETERESTPLIIFLARLRLSVKPRVEDG